jgi:hypothetical protein
LEFLKIMYAGAIKVGEKVGRVGRKLSEKVVNPQQSKVESGWQLVTRFADQDYNFVNSFHKKQSAVGGPIADLLRGQIVVQNWSLKLNLVTKVSEVAVNTIKKFQSS